MAKRPIWMITAHFYPAIGGGERQAQRQAKELQMRGWPVSVLTRRHSPILPDNLAAAEDLDGLSVARIYSKGGKIASLFFLLLGLWHLLLHGRGAVYHAHDVGATGWLAIIARYLLGGRSVIKLRTGKYLYEKAYTSGIAARQFTAQLRLTDRIIVVNGEVEQYLCALGVPAERIIRVPNGIDADRFQPVGPEEETAARHRLNLPVDKKMVIYVGRLEAVKGVDILIRAWARLSDEIRAGACLVIIGDGAERANLERLCETLHMQDSIMLVGMQRNVMDYYHATDLMVLPSRTEGLSNSLLEAMAIGLPCIASNVGGAPDFIEEGKSGFLFKAEDDEQLKRQLDHVLTHPEQWQTIGAAARQAVIAYADMASVIDKLESIYAELESSSSI